MKLLLAILSIFSILSCDSNSSKSKFRQHIVEESVIPDSILKKYLKTSGLAPIDVGVDSFEVRQWASFYRDSFPTFLQRIYYSKGDFYGDFFVFMTKDSKVIRSLEGLDSMKFDKFQIQSIKNDVIDSILNDFNIAKFNKIDIKVFKEANKEKLWTITPYNILFEQATKADYFATFIPNPMLFPELDSSVKKYAGYFQFIHNACFQSNSEFKLWLEKNVDRINK